MSNTDQSTFGTAGKLGEAKLWSSLRDVCNLLKLPQLPAADGANSLYQHIRYRTGQRIFLAGETFKNIYLIRYGFIKNVIVDEHGNEQILSFPMSGDILGADAFSLGAHPTEAVALSDSEVIVIPYKALFQNSRDYPQFDTFIYEMVSNELISRQSMAAMLYGLSAEAKVARFLVNLGKNFERIGYSRKIFNLRMTRQEIGSYLGLTIETVSRAFSAFSSMGYINVDMRNIQILDEDRLASLRRLPPNKSKTRNSNPEAKVKETEFVG
jgi:CRP/FNR family transcriptional regulator